MSATAVAAPPSFIDPELTSAVMGAVHSALTMCDTSAH
jgi:hypothetical protein